MRTSFGSLVRKPGAVRCRCWGRCLFFLDELHTRCAGDKFAAIQEHGQVDQGCRYDVGNDGGLRLHGWRPAALGVVPNLLTDAWGNHVPSPNLRQQSYAAWSIACSLAVSRAR